MRNLRYLLLLVFFGGVISLGVWCGSVAYQAPASKDGPNLLGVASVFLFVFGCLGLIINLYFGPPPPD